MPASFRSSEPSPEVISSSVLKKRRAALMSRSQSWFSFGFERKVSAKADSIAWRMLSWRGKKAWISGDAWPMRDCSSNSEMAG